MDKGELGLRRFCSIFLFVISAFPQLLSAQEDDSLFLQRLDASYVSEYRNTSMISGNTLSEISFDIEALDKYPKLFGQSDPIRFVQSLPGVQTASIFEPGISVMGCSNSQNEFSLAGAPFYPAPRLLGLFPMVNTDAFSEMKFKPSSSGNFLGGSLSLDLPDSLVTAFHAAGSVGMISSQATVRLPISKTMDVTASGRKSYLNLIYGSLMTFAESAVKYDYWDVNGTLKWKPDERNSVDATVYYSNDVGNVDVWSCKTDGYLNHKLAVARWSHKGDWMNQKHTFYASDASKDFHLYQQAGNGMINIYRKEIGWNSDMELPYGINVRPLFTYYHIMPQNAFMDNDFRSEQEVQESQKALLASVSVDKTFEAGNFKFTPQLLLNYYDELGYEEYYVHLDPTLRVEYDMYDKGRIVLDLGRKHQYLSELTVLPSSVPMQFWIADGHYNDPQVSYYATLSHSVNFGGGKWSLTSQLYGKRVLNQLEFNGFYLTMVLSHYDLQDYLLKTEGYNYGASIMFSKNTGRLTGWISYAYSKALRQTNERGYPSTFPASYERPHEVNLVATWEVGQFDLGGTLVFASGTPFTPIESFYVVSDTFLAKFADYNSGRLAPYFRVDLSVTWNFKQRGRFNHGVNLSVYNATFSKNETGYCLQVDKDNQFFYGPTEWQIRVIPSLSYFIKL